MPKSKVAIYVYESITCSLYYHSGLRRHKLDFIHENAIRTDWQPEDHQE
jgi:hypothetical protein